MIKLEIEAVFENGNDFDYGKLLKIIQKATKSTIILTPIKKEKQK